MEHALWSHRVPALARLVDPEAVVALDADEGVVGIVCQALGNFGWVLSSAASVKGVEYGIWISRNRFTFRRLTCTRDSVQKTVLALDADSLIVEFETRHAKRTVRAVRAQSNSVNGKQQKQFEHGVIKK